MRPVHPETLEYYRLLHRQAHDMGLEHATDRRIAFHMPGEVDGPINIIIPAPRFMGMLMHGGLVPRLRVVAETDDHRPLVDGSGELMPAMTEDEAIEFIRWKDMPIAAQGTNRWAILNKQALPAHRIFRNAWDLMQ